MADIIERSLALTVVGEDEASDVFAAIADQVDDLQARFETSFSSMASYAEDTSSTIADAAQEWAPVWISQLEALETAAAATFSALEGYFATVETNAETAGAAIAAAFSTDSLGLDPIPYS